MTVSKAIQTTAQIVAPVRNSTWVTRDRLFSYSTIIIAIYAAIISWTLAGHGINDPAGRPVGTDFVSFWTVSSALLTGNEHAIYSPEALTTLEHDLLPIEKELFYAWQYPPIALLLVYPLAFLPYLWSLASWLAAGIACYITVLWRILPQPLTLGVGLAFPAVLLTIEHGQNALLSTSLLGWALLLLTRRPIAAGVLLGFLSFKPQLGVLLPIALVAGGHWKTILAAMLTGAGLVATTVALFGGAIWHDFIASMQLSRDILDQGLVPYYKMQSVFAAVRLLGSSLILAYSLQAIVAAGVAAAVVWVWGRATDPDLKNAIVVVATPIATPFFLDYDLMIVAPAITWLARKGLKEGMPPWQGTMLALLWLMPLVSRPIGACTDILLGPLVVAGGFASIFVQVSRGLNASAPSRPAVLCG
jgi:hypothetical protein